MALAAKNPPASAMRHKRCGSDPWVERIPWKKQPTAIVLPGKSHGQRSLAGYTVLRVKKELDN